MSAHFGVLDSAGDLVDEIRQVLEGDTELLVAGAVQAKLPPWVEKELVCVKISGRATFSGSVDFRAVVHGLVDRGYRQFILDVTECLSMDSTFLGVLAGFGQRVAGGTGCPVPDCIELLNPNNRIMDLLENLGALSLELTAEDHRRIDEEFPRGGRRALPVL